MKTVRPDEFASRHSEDSIRSIASRSDDQMSFLLSTIDQIDEGTRIHASVGEQLIKKFDDKLREGDAIVVQLFKVFKLIAHVKDDSGEANFLLFDANAQQIVRHSAFELYDETSYQKQLAISLVRVLFEISVDVDNIKGKSSQYVVRLATDDCEMVEEFADLPPKPILMLESADDISSGSGGFTATPLSKRKSEQDEDSSLEVQHSVNKKPSQKKLKGE
ncbi:hypothetical protein YC2023_083570 [Brassica napus]